MLRAGIIARRAAIEQRLERRSQPLGNGGDETGPGDIRGSGRGASFGELAQRDRKQSRQQRQRQDQSRGQRWLLLPEPGRRDNTGKAEKAQRSAP